MNCLIGLKRTNKQIKHFSTTLQSDLIVINQNHFFEQNQNKKTSITKVSKNFARKQTQNYLCSTMTSESWTPHDWATREVIAAGVLSGTSLDGFVLFAPTTPRTTHKRKLTNSHSKPSWIGLTLQSVASVLRHHAVNCLLTSRVPLLNHCSTRLGELRRARLAPASFAVRMPRSGVRSAPPSVRRTRPIQKTK